MQRFIDLTLNGIANGAIYAAVALSLVLIWRATRILNFAQAGMLMFTTFIAWAVIDHGASYWVGFVVALLSGLVLGALIERLIIRPVEGAPPLNAIIVTLGVLVLLQALAGMIWGGNPRSFPPAFSIKGYEVGGRAVLFSPFDLFTVVVVGALMARPDPALHPDEPGPAHARGGVRAGGRAPRRRPGRPHVHRGWALASVAGSLAGVLVAPSVFVAPNTFDAVLVFGFTAAVIGGPGEPARRAGRRHHCSASRSATSRATAGRSSSPSAHW